MPQSERSKPGRVRRSFGSSSLFEPLEGRRLLSVAAFGDAGTVIRYPAAAAAFPSATGAGQTIAVIDSGIDYTHPSLGGGFGAGKKVIGGYDFVDNDADPMDTFGHGTEVSGILAASPAAGSQYQGIAPQAKLVALRVGRDEDDSVPDSRIEQALQWVIANRTTYGITVVNISYGQGSFNTPTVSSVYGDEIATLREAGVSIVAASGNDYQGASPKDGINSPAADPNVISVGSVAEDGVTVTNTSQRGPDLTMLAPGEDVMTTFLDGSYGLVGGTSFASPIVAATVALMRSVNATLTPAETTSILRASGVSTFDGGPKTGNFTRQFYPRLDLLNALNLANARKPGTTAAQALVGQYGNQNAVAIDPEGVTHFVYYDAPAQTMKYATRSTSGQWSNTQIIDNSLPFQGYYLSLALDRLGQPSVAYFDGTNGDLKYARYDGSTWNVQSVDVKNSTGAYPSLVFDRNGLAVITYYRKTTGDLRAASRNLDGSFTITSVATTGDVGRFTSAALSPSGNIGVSYEDSTDGWLGYSEFNARNGTWSNTIADKSTRGVSYISTAFSTDDGSPWISYYDAYPANLKSAHFSKKAWKSETIAARGAVGLFTTFFFDLDDKPNVLYWDKTKNELDLATYDGSWVASRVQADGGRFASVAVDRTDGLLRYGYYGTDFSVHLGERSLAQASS